MNNDSVLNSLDRKNQYVDRVNKSNNIVILDVVLINQAFLLTE